MSEALMNLHARIMNIRAVKTLSHFIKVSEYEAYLLGHKQARHDAAEIASSVSEQLKAADELAERAEAVFRSEYHNTNHIEGAKAYFDANMAALTAYRKAKEQAQ